MYSGSVVSEIAHTKFKWNHWLCTDINCAKMLVQMRGVPSSSHAL